MSSSLYIAWKYLFFSKARSATLVACITLIAVLMILLNLVNTTGEYILSRLVVAQADAALESGGADVVVTDGFSGNIALKAAEGPLGNAPRLTIAPGSAALISFRGLHRALYRGAHHMPTHGGGLSVVETTAE